VTRTEGPSTISLSDFADGGIFPSSTTQTETHSSDRREAKSDYHDLEKVPLPSAGARGLTTKTSTTNLAFTANISEPEKSESGEAYPTSASSVAERLSLLPGRPDAGRLIKECIAQMGSDGGDGRKKVVVAACGPKTLMTEVRDTVVEVIQKSASNGPGVELHCERFGW
jgi:hypothetical protein